jgi:amino acid transporter
LSPIVNVGSLAFISGWFMTCLASIRLRKTAPEMNRPYRAKHGVVLYLGGLISGVLILLMILPGSSAQLAWPFEYTILAGWMLLGYLAYRWRKSTRDMSPGDRAYHILGDYR